MTIRGVSARHEVVVNGVRYPGRLYLRGDRWWHQAHGNRVSTGMRDRLAAELWVARKELIRAHGARRIALREAIDCAHDVELEESDGWCYFVANERGEVKIGRAIDLNKRLSTLRSYAADELTLLGKVRGGEIIESCLHERFSAIRVRGEWFRSTSELVEFVQRYAE